MQRNQIRQSNNISQIDTSLINDVNDDASSSFSSSANGVTYRFLNSVEEEEIVSETQNDLFKFNRLNKERLSSLGNEMRLSSQMRSERNLSLLNPSPLRRTRMSLDKYNERPLDLIQKGISMDPDMVFGWKPQIECSSPPIPLYFDFVEHNLSIYDFENRSDKIDIIVYQELRSKDSFQLHKRFSNKMLCEPQTLMTQDLQNQNMNSFLGQAYKFTFPKHFENGKFKYDKVLTDLFGDYQSTGAAQNHFNEEEDYFGFTGMNPYCLKKNEIHKNDIKVHNNETIIFDSIFESGNIDLVIKTQPHEYDIFLRPDSNSKGKFQWYFFQTTNRLKGTRVKFNIMNITKRNSLYLQGLSPSILSFKKSKEQGVGWYKSGQNVSYRFSRANKIGVSPNDDEGEGGSFKMSYFSKTLGGVDIPLITITNNLSTDQSQQALLGKKKIVFIIARVHPGETNSSLLAHGLIQYLLSQDKIANYLRENLVFKIIPMINPDGVIVGNNRTSFLGRDMNRSYDNPNEQLTPETFHLKQLVGKLIKNYQQSREFEGQKIMGIFDIHQHAGRKSIFIMEKYKEGCARQAMWTAFNIQNCYTIECSALGYYTKDRETITFDEQVLKDFGIQFAHSLFEYCMIQEDSNVSQQRSRVFITRNSKAINQNHADSIRTLQNHFVNDNEQNILLRPKLQQQQRLMDQRNKSSKAKHDRETLFKSGFETIDADELYMRLYNPYALQWKAKSDENKQNLKLEKQNNLTQTDDFYNKQIRTLEELFNQIKKDSQNEEHDPIPQLSRVVERKNDNDSDDLDQNTVQSKSESPPKKLRQFTDKTQNYLQTRKSIQRRPYFNRLQFINLDQQVLGRSYMEYKQEELEKLRYLYESNNLNIPTLTSQLKNQQNLANQSQNSIQGKANNIFSYEYQSQTSQNKNQVNIYDMIFQQKRKLSIDKQNKLREQQNQKGQLLQITSGLQNLREKKQNEINNDEKLQKSKKKKIQEDQKQITSQNLKIGIKGKNKTSETLYDNFKSVATTVKNIGKQNRKDSIDSQQSRSKVKTSKNSQISAIIQGNQLKIQQDPRKLNVDKSIDQTPSKVDFEQQTNQSRNLTLTQQNFRISKSLIKTSTKKNTEDLLISNNPYQNLDIQQEIEEQIDLKLTSNNKPIKLRLKDKNSKKTMNNWQNQDQKNQQSPIVLVRDESLEFITSSNNSSQQSISANEITTQDYQLNKSQYEYGENKKAKSTSQHTRNDSNNFARFVLFTRSYFKRLTAIFQNKE
eukprot:403337255